MGGVGSHKRIFGGIHQFNSDWIYNFFAIVPNDIFGNLCVKNNLIDDWQSNVGIDVLDKWLTKSPLRHYHKEFDFSDYQIDRYIWTHGKKQIPMLGSHGCVRQCSFCDVIKHFPRYSYIEADTLTKSLVDVCAETGINKVQFMDSLVNGSMTNFLKLLQNLTQARQKSWLAQDFSWSGTYICRPPSKLLDQIHQYLKPSGADNLVIGVESGSDRIRFEMQKKFTNNDLIAELDSFDVNGLKASALFFPSWPTETEADFEQTLELFQRLARYSHSGTLDTVNLGVSGFALIDGTPIDTNKDKIGLIPGPLPWLWKCTSNPDLNFWTSLSRRFAMAEWCETFGIRLDDENTSRQMLYLNLQEHRQAILAYSGTLKESINFRKLVPSSISHHLVFSFVNSGTHDVKVHISIDNIAQNYLCPPGTTEISLDCYRDLTKSQKIKLWFDFHSTHQCYWQRHDSGDFYDKNGIYIDKIMIDHKDITYWGWNQIINLTWLYQKNLPEDYYNNLNLRCITSGMQISIDLPEYVSLHRYVMQRTDPHTYDNRAKINTRLDSILDTF